MIEPEPPPFPGEGGTADGDMDPVTRCGGLLDPARQPGDVERALRQPPGERAGQDGADHHDGQGDRQQHVQPAPERDRRLTGNPPHAQGFQ